MKKDRINHIAIYTQDKVSVVVVRMSGKIRQYNRISISSRIRLSDISYDFNNKYIVAITPLMSIFISRK